MKLVPTSISPVTITLYRGIPFDNNYEEHTLLSNKFKFKAYSDSTPTNIGNDKEAFINMMKNGSYVYPRTTKSGTYNFAFGNGLVTSVVMELTGNEINSNYMKVVSNGDSYYYFITGITQKNEVTYLLNLELDVVMTYSEEFLTNIEHKPVMVERKHCRRVQRTKFGTSLTTKINPVCFNQESTFTKLKSNVVKDFMPLEFKEFVNGEYDFNDIMSDLLWIYIIVGKGAGVHELNYTENGLIYPYYMICIPNKPMYIDYAHDGTISRTNLNPKELLEKLIGNPVVQKIIISPFPPFRVCDNMVMGKIDGEDRIVWSVNADEYGTTKHTFYTGKNKTGTYFYYETTTEIPYSNTFYIQNGYGGKFEYTNLNNYFNTNIPSINNTRDTGEYKLQISPFKDLRMSSYYGGENHINTQYLFLKEMVGDGVLDVKPYTIASTNAEVNSYFDYCDVGDYAVDSKRGISNSVAYNFPTGTNAELIYNQTQKNQYENTRLISGISNGLKIVGGGIGSLLSPNTLSKATSAVSILSGVVGEIESFTSWSAKMEDLKNTSNTYNFSGSSLPYDYAIAQSGNKNNKNLLPYLITYGVTSIEQDMAGEFLYNYGYEYNTNSEFSTTLTHTTDYVFERRLFNYVKIREDISTKLVGDNLPIIVAQKFNEILNAGIKLWTFFGFNFSSPQDVTDIVDSYFQKDTYCNAEVVDEQFE